MYCFGDLVSKCLYVIFVNSDFVYVYVSYLFLACLVDFVLFKMT